MSTVTLLSSIMPDLLPMQDRSPGIHLSDIINDLSIRQGHYSPSPLNMARAQLGNALEWAMIERLMRHEPGRYIRLPEVEKDGVYCTLDLVDRLGDPTRRLRRPNEFKLTWQTLVDDPDLARGISSDGGVGNKGFWKYETQACAQALVIGAEEAALPVTHMMGDYRKDRAPAYREWLYQWTRMERQRNWDKLLRHRDRMIAESDEWRRIAMGGERER